jgi:hypothetical protein
MITYSRCLSIAFVTQHAKRMRRIMLSSVASLALSHSSRLSHITARFSGGGEEGGSYSVIYFLIFSTAFGRNISDSEKNSVRSEM